MADTDVVRSVRWKENVHRMLTELTDELERSEGWIANKAIEQYFIMRAKVKGQFGTSANGGAGVSTYRATLEFQLPATIWADRQAYELFFQFLEQLKTIAPNGQEAYGQIDAIRPMDYNGGLETTNLVTSQKSTELSDLGILVSDLESKTFTPSRRIGAEVIVQAGDHRGKTGKFLGHDDETGCAQVEIDGSTKNIRYSSIDIDGVKGI